MITPNFERLAKRSVIFDFVYSQVSVCNPSRDSLLTGLRPDTVGTYNFQHSHKGHMLLPIQLARLHYNTAGIGKILHFGCNNPKIWTFDRWDDNWYTYQDYERRFLNSSVTPDQWRPIDWFRDYKFVNRTIVTLKKLVKKKNYFMLAMGFKLPHLTLHVPFKYYQLYDNDKTRNSWKLSKEELTFPASSPFISYRCCNEKRFEFILRNGSAKSIKSIPIGDVQSPTIVPEMHNELMMGYSAAVSFVDAQLGRILDVIDELELWNNLTVVLTADHGMHNGEKGMW
jgi:iduronate 2-sulfatase